MKVEIRVREYEELDRYLELKVDAISIGDDGCVHRLPNKSQVISLAEKILNSGKELKFVTPKAPQEHFECIMDIIERLTNFTKEYTLVVNDFGILEACNERDIKIKNILIGRSISRAIEECPWSDDLVKNETKKMEILTNNFPDSKKIQLLEKYGVDGIESSLLTNSHYSFSWIKEAGWNVSAHLGSVTIAYSRNCQYAKYKKLKMKECKNDCKEKIYIEMSKVSNGTDFIPVIDKIDKNRLRFFLSGNILCRDNKIDVEQFNLRDIDNLVFSTNDYSLEELEAIIKKVGGQNGK